VARATEMCTVQAVASTMEVAPAVAVATMAASMTSTMPSATLAERHARQQGRQNKNGNSNGWFGHGTLLRHSRVVRGTTMTPMEPKVPPAGLWARIR